jgi:hypothetical protein
MSYNWMYIAESGVQHSVRAGDCYSPLNGVLRSCTVYGSSAIQHLENKKTSSDSTALSIGVDYLYRM